jgi:hypothetical protein
MRILTLNFAAIHTSSNVSGLCAGLKCELSRVEDLYARAVLARDTPRGGRPVTRGDRSDHKSVAVHIGPSFPADKPVPQPRKA